MRSSSAYVRAYMSRAWADNGAGGEEEEREEGEWNRGNDEGGGFTPAL